MGIEKSEIKAGTMAAFSDDLEKAIVAQENEIQKLDGAASALKDAGKNIEGIMVAFKASLEAEDFEPPTDAASFAKITMGWIRRCYGVTVSMADQNSAQGLVVQGRVQGLKVARDRSDKIKVTEEAKAKALQDAEDSKVIPFPEKRPVGQRPPMSIAAQRKAEEAARRAAEASGDEDDQGPAQEKSEPQKATRRRKKKTEEKTEAKPRRRRKKKAPE